MYEKTEQDDNEEIVAPVEEAATATEQEEDQAETVEGSEQATDEVENEATGEEEESFKKRYSDSTREYQRIQRENKKERQRLESENSMLQEQLRATAQKKQQEANTQETQYDNDDPDQRARAIINSEMEKVLAKDKERAVMGKFEQRKEKFNQVVANYSAVLPEHEFQSVLLAMRGSQQLDSEGVLGWNEGGNNKRVISDPQKAFDTYHRRMYPGSTAKKKVSSAEKSQAAKAATPGGSGKVDTDLQKAVNNLTDLEKEVAMSTGFTPEQYAEAKINPKYS